MNNIILHTKPCGEVVGFVKLPKGAEAISVENYNIPLMQCSTILYKSGNRKLEVPITLGKWVFINTYEGITEKQAQTIMELHRRVYGYSYYDYSVKFESGYGWCGTALQSIRSLLSSLGIITVNPYKNIEPYFLKGSENTMSPEEYAAWQSAEEKVWHTIAILKQVK